jgi:predicted TIM-barrel fold metal-dependent hydrolase
MPFDVDTVVRTTNSIVAQPALEIAAPLSAVFALAADPDPRWAAKYPDRFLAFLFVSPRDCAAIDELIAA